MNSVASKGYQTYQKNKYETASPHRLILMLYAGAIKFVKLATSALETGDTALGHKHLLRAQDIVYELISSLNEKQGGEISRNLKSMYLYMIDQMVQANIQKSAQPLSVVLDMLESIQSAWAHIGKDIKHGQEHGS